MVVQIWPPPQSAFEAQGTWLFGSGVGPPPPTGAALTLSRVQPADSTNRLAARAPIKFTKWERDIKVLRLSGRLPGLVTSAVPEPRSAAKLRFTVENPGFAQTWAGRSVND